MVIPKYSAKHFFSLWLPLLKYTNDNFHILDNPRLKKVDHYKDIDTEEGKHIANRIWANDEIIDEYIREHPDLLEFDQQCILRWKKHITGRFFVTREIQKGAAFMHIKNDKPSVYFVSGIFSTFKDLFLPRHLPLFVDTTLLPFRSFIVTDSFIAMKPLYFSKDVRADLKRYYREARIEGRNYTKID